MQGQVVDYRGHECLSFSKDISRGKVGEEIFKEDFLSFLGIEYVDVTGCQKFQVIDSDYLTKIGTYEIKTNYKDNKEVIIEEYTNINEEYCKKSYGWFYKTKADLLVFISKKTRVMVMIPFTKNFKDFYDWIKDGYSLERNRPTKHNGKMWQSAFRRIPLDSITGFYSMYKRVS